MKPDETSDDIVERLCEQFESDWEHGATPSLEDVLLQAPDGLRDRLLAELVPIEFWWRGRRGDVAEADEYRLRFPWARLDWGFVLAAAAGTYPPGSRSNLRAADEGSGATTLAASAGPRPRFRRIHRLGAGGQGEVWLALDLELHRFVALKQLQRVKTGSSGAESRFRREAEVTGKLEHPHIVPVYEAGWDRASDGTDSLKPYYVMRVYGDRRLQRALEAADQRWTGAAAETWIQAILDFYAHPTLEYEARLQQMLAEARLEEVFERDRDLLQAVEALRVDRPAAGGRTLQQAIVASHERPRSAGQLRELIVRFLHVCQAVAYAHSRGVIHRDLKPQNVMLGEFGETLVVDWGLAKVVGRNDCSLDPLAEGTVRIEGDPTSRGAATGVGDLIGTLAYMPPEQAWGRVDELGPVSDIYCLGGILYTILTGVAPRQGTHKELLEQARQGMILPPRRLQPNIPKALEAICLKSLATAPTHRYPAVERLIADIQAWLADEPVSAWNEPLSARLARWVRRHRVVAAATIVGLLSLLTLSLIFGFAQRRTSEQLRQTLQQSIRQSALAAWEYARRLCEEDHVAHGLLILAQSLDSLPRDPYLQDLDSALRHELGGWLGHVHEVSAMWPHPAAVTRVVVEPGGAWAVTGCADGQLRRWDTATGDCVATIAAHTAAITAVALVPRTERCFTAGEDGTVMQWDLRTATLLDRLEGTFGIVRALAVDPRGEWLLTGGSDGIARLWSLSDLTCRHELDRHADIHAVGFHPDEALFFTGGRAGIDRDEQARGMMIVQRLTGDGLSEPVELRNSVNRQFRYRVGTAAFSPQGRYLLVGDDDWNGTLWDASDWTQLASTDHPQGRLRDLAWSGDGLLVLFAADDSHRAVLWDQSLVESRIRNQSLWGLHDSVTRDEIRSYSSLLHPGAVTAVAFLDRNANRLVTGCVDGYARVWRRAPGLTTTLLPHNPRRPELESTPNRDWVVRAVATHPWGQLAATAGFDGHVRLWDVRDGHPLATTLAHGSPVVSLAFTSDGRRLWSGAKDGRIRVWDVSAGTPVAELPHHGGVVSGLSVSLQEPLALAGGDGAARLWHLDSLRPAGLRISHAELAESVFTDISPAADRLLTAGEQGQARLWDRQGELLHELAHKMGVWTGRFSHDGNWVVTASRDHTARVWNAHTGEAFALFQHESDVFSADFLPGDHVVITGSASGAQLWDVALERKLGPACKHLSDIVDVASTPDGRTAVLAEWDGYGILWRIPQPVTGTPRDIMLQIQRKTGMKLNDQGGMETIDSHEWLRLPRPQDRP